MKRKNRVLKVSGVEDILENLPFAEKWYRELIMLRKPIDDAEDNSIVIRTMQTGDAQIITEEENAQGWHADIEKYNMRLQHQSEGRAISLIAEYQGNIAGYINVYFNAEYGAFANKGYPEIVDFGVLIKYRRHGIGSKLMDAAEQIASQISPWEMPIWTDTLLS